MKVRATAKFVRISPRKARLVIDQVRGVSIAEAERTLQFMNKKAAEPVLKLIKSAVANAEHNNKQKKEHLYIAEITANDGFTMKRWRPRAFGRATKIRKRTTHLTVVLDETEEYKQEAAAKAKKAKKTAKAKKESATKKPEAKKEEKKPTAKKKQASPAADSKKEKKETTKKK